MDFCDSILGGGKLSMEVRIFSSLSSFYILNLLFRVDFALREDLLLRMS